MSDPLAVRPSNPVLAWATAVGVVGLALGGFTLSFAALRSLAVRSGIEPGLAFIWPLIVDGFIVVATAAAFALKRRGRRVTWYPWAALVVFSAISVAGNASHAVDGTAAVSVPLWAATVVSSVPAVALLVASHLLVVMIDGRARPARRKEPVRRQAPGVEPSLALSAPPAEGGRDAIAGGLVPVGAALGLLQVVEPGEREPSLVGRLQSLVASGTVLTGGLIAQLEGVSERTGRRRLEQLREEHPGLFAAELAEAAR